MYNYIVKLFGTRFRVQLAKVLGVVSGHQVGVSGFSSCVALFLCLKDGWEICWLDSSKAAIRRELQRQLQSSVLKVITTLSYELLLCMIF